jgi:hypothetical protein
VDIALIPPAALMDYARQFQTQMMLPGPRQLEYLAYYRRINDRFIILDNGAWEMEPLNTGDLIGTGYRFQVQEVVAPDILYDPRGTLQAMHDFFDTFTPASVAFPNWRPDFMAVAHGPNQETARDFVRKVVNEFPRVTTIAAGRAFTRQAGDRFARARLAEWVKNTYGEGGPKFHLLGYNDEWNKEVTTCRDFVRSLDTVAPFTAAFYGIPLETVVEGKYPRPKNYFDLPTGVFDIDLLEANIRYLREEAGL